MPNSSKLQGKRPVASKWTTDPDVRFDADEARLRLVSGLNVGVVLGPIDLVLDIDPRNGGEKGWELLKADLKINDKAYPHSTDGIGADCTCTCACRKERAG